MALDFPASPSNGQIFSAPTGVIYVYSSAAGLWTVQGGPLGAATIADTPPAGATPGSLWWSSALGQLFIYYNDGNSSQWVVTSTNSDPATSTPPGSIIDFAGSSAPSGWYLCDGSLKNRITDAPLFAAIGTVYGAGDGSTTFAVPDLRGRVTAGKEATPTRLTTAVSGIDGSVLGAAGGDQNMPQHLHGLPYPPINYTGGTFWATLATGPNVNFYISTTTNNAGTGTASNVPPTMILNKIIKR